MLVLGRKTGESIMIGDAIKVSVLDIEGKQVKVGIDAPPEMHVLRKELNDEAHETEVSKTAQFDKYSD